jgi:hypothetical protein
MRSFNLINVMIKFKIKKKIDIKINTAYMLYHFVL